MIISWLVLDFYGICFFISYKFNYFWLYNKLNENKILRWQQAENILFSVNI